MVPNIGFLRQFKSAHPTCHITDGSNAKTGDWEYSFHSSRIDHGVCNREKRAPLVENGARTCHESFESAGALV
jgi:hypothetical protein